MCQEQHSLKLAPQQSSSSGPLDPVNPSANGKGSAQSCHLPDWPQFSKCFRSCVVVYLVLAVELSQVQAQNAYSMC